MEAAIEFREDGALAGKGVDVRGRRQPAPVKGHIFCSQGVEGDEHEVRFGPLWIQRRLTTADALLPSANSVATSAAVPTTVATAVRRVIFSPRKSSRLVTTALRARGMKSAMAKRQELGPRARRLSYIARCSDHE